MKAETDCEAKLRGVYLYTPAEKLVCSLMSNDGVPYYLSANTNIHTKEMQTSRIEGGKKLPSRVNLMVFLCCGR